MVDKGSVAVDGISLTVNTISGHSFSLMQVIPETLKRTTLSGKKPGDAVNLEADILGKYVARLLQKGQKTKGLTLEKLRRRRLLSPRKFSNGKTALFTVERVRIART